MPDLKETIEALKIQRSVLKDGGYGRSVRTPWKETQLFRDSLTCLNFDEPTLKHSCDECVLSEWVPAEHRKEDIPCHHIPLNEKGESIATLENAADRQRAEEALLEWLDTMISRLEQKLESQQTAGS